MLNFFEHIKDRIQGKAPKGAKRSSDWRKIRKEHLKKHPCCAVCGSSKKLNVHHILPYHICPDMELDPENLVTLCEGGKYKGLNCHLLIGHLCSYRKTNPSVKSDVAEWNAKLN